MWDWLSIVVIIAIVLVVLDGLRRKFREKNALKVKLDNSAPGAELDEELSSELPSGGARTIPRGAARSSHRRREPDRRDARDTRDTRERVEPGFGDILDDEPPTPDTHQTEQSMAEDERDDWPDEAGEVTVEDMPDAEEGMADDTADEVPAQAGSLTEQPGDVDTMDVPDEFPREGNTESSSVFDDEDSPHADAPLVADSQDAPAASRRQKKKPGRTFSERFFRHSSVQNELPLDDDESAAPSEEAQSDAGEGDEVEEVIIINVMAPAGQYFDGGQLLQILLRQGMRLGNMSIFHRHADSSGSGPVMFSMANMVKPGTFDMATMESFTTPGVSLFTQLPSRLPHMRNFDLMLETAQCLRDELGGELKDENRSDLTRQTIEHYRQRIQDFELHRLARK